MVMDDLFGRLPSEYHGHYNPVIPFFVMYYTQFSQLIEQNGSF